MKLTFEGTTDEFTEALAVLKCFATVENIVDDETVKENPAVFSNSNWDLVLFFTALSRGGVHLDSCKTLKSEFILSLFNVNRYWSFKINEKTFDNETPTEVARRCMELGHKDES